jgi:hypothetical protein
MNFQASRRSQSQNRNDGRFNPITAEYEPNQVYNSPMKERGDQQNYYGRNSPAPRDIHSSAAKEILRQSYNGGNEKKYSPQEEQQYSPMKEQYASPNKMRPDNSVGQVTNQEFYSKPIFQENPKVQDRKNRYKEVLDHMMEQERDRKNKEKESKRDGTVHNPHALNAYAEMEKMQEQEEKRRVKELLNRDLEEARKREEERKRLAVAEKKEFDDMTVKLRKVDEHLKEQEKYVKQQTLGQYKLMLDQCKRELDDRKRKEADDNLKWAVYEYEDITRKDIERQKFYVEIRERVNKELAAFRPFIEEKKEKEKLIETNIQKAVQEKKEKDEMEARKKEDYLKNMKQSIKEHHEYQLHEKEEKKKNLKVDLQHEWEDTITQIKSSQILTQLEKERKLDQAKEYYTHLYGQMKEKQSAVDPYKGGKNETIFGENSYERNLQWKYLDSWLNENPQNPYGSKAKVQHLRNETGNVVLQQKVGGTHNNIFGS